MGSGTVPKPPRSFNPTSVGLRLLVLSPDNLTNKSLQEGFVMEFKIFGYAQCLRYSGF